MRKFLLGAVALFLMVGCAGSGTKEGTSDDAKAQADSMAKVAEAQAAAEQARQDSLRQDSLRRDSIARIKTAIASIPTFNEFLKHGQDPSYFKNKGFNVTVKYSSNERDGAYKIVEGSYQPAPGVICTFEDSTVGDDYMQITVVGAPDVLNKIYTDAQIYVRSQKRNCPNYEVRKKGNTIECIFDPYG